MEAAGDILDIVSDLKATGEAFALATVVRTVAATSAKAGAKAVIRPDGTVSEGWIGGGCARAAVLKAARAALADGKPRLVSIQPEDLLADQGVSAGSEAGGIVFARNSCPSQGTMDVFVEPMLPKPELRVFGASPVAVALAGLGRDFGYRVVALAPNTTPDLFGPVDAHVDGFDIDSLDSDGPVTRDRYAVVATQGAGDQAALGAALSIGARHVAFVGSARKMARLRDRLAEDGIDGAALDRVKAPAGLDIGAITPKEIALSILAEIIRFRRHAQNAVAEQGA